MRTILLFFLLNYTAATSFAQWTEPVLIDSNQDTVGINTGRPEWCPYISADGEYFYFTRTSRNNDIFVCHRTDDGWSEPLMLPFCDPDRDERNPAVNATNDTIYFISWAPGWDIFWAFRTGPEDTSWSEPAVMPQPINSTGIEFSVWTTPDNRRLLFSSWRDSGVGGEDIYECRRDANTVTGWSEPHLLEGVLNTFHIESYPSMGLDTTEIFFWGRFSRIYQSVLTENGWLRGDSLPDTINRVIIDFPSERTPCIVPAGDRLYFMSSWNGDSLATSGDIWYSDRIEAIGPEPHRMNSDTKHFEIEVFPNPVREQIWIQATSDLASVAVFDILGRKITDQQLPYPQSRFLWNLSDISGSLATGTYFLIGQNRTSKRAVRITVIR